MFGIRELLEVEITDGGGRRHKHVVGKKEVASILVTSNRVVKVYSKDKSMTEYNLSFYTGGYKEVPLEAGVFN
ncbi:hypothetical protein PI27_gp048 [Listeria phage WIL-1]|nr:hypothetical protein PI27_gp048 [Listeria phage WIL-1]